MFEHYAFGYSCDPMGDHAVEIRYRFPGDDRGDLARSFTTEEKARRFVDRLLAAEPDTEIRWVFRYPNAEAHAAVERLTNRAGEQGS
jgi:hypothetical protein